MACGCGCGGEQNRGKTFIRGHHRLGKTLERAKALKENASPETVRRREAKKVWYAANREKVIAYGLKWREKNKDKQRANYRRRKAAYRDRLLKRVYGIDTEQFNAMREAQNGACVICQEPFTKMPHVDHCHTTGKVRSLLCEDCNIGLGRFKDNPARLEAAATYLREHSAPLMSLTRTA